MTPRKKTEINSDAAIAATVVKDDAAIAASVIKSEAVAVAAALLGNDIAHIKEDISEIKASFKDIKTFYLTKDEFSPVRNIVYGMVGLILIAVVGAIVALVVA